MTWSIGSRRHSHKRNFSFTPLEKLFLTRKRNSPTGFSLLEVLVVVAIVGAIFALGIPRFRGTFDSLRFQNFCQDLLARMRYLNERASVEQVIYRLTFDFSSARAEITFKADPEENIFEEVRGRLGKAMPIPAGIAIETSPQGIFFFPDGSIAGADIHLRDSHRSATIKINNSLGRLSLEENEENR